jgi:1-acyl-sn-glycerol-3-phosphate acyltransferase
MRFPGVWLTVELTPGEVWMTTEALPVWTEPRAVLVKRRAVSIPGLFFLTAVGVIALPLLIASSLLWDAAHRRPLASTRAVLAVVASFVIHSVALVWLFGVWLRDGAWRSGDVEREGRRSYRVESAICRFITHTVLWLFGMDTCIEGEEALDDPAHIMLAKHTSLLDPVVLICLVARRDVALRYVAKRELLWDPCIDVLGHRFPVTFVWRKKRGHHEDLAGVTRLLDDMGERDAVLVFPEGTRFSEEKKQRALAALEEAHQDLAARAARWRHMLPPHPGGTLALLHRDSASDVVVCAHTGMEGASHLRDFFDGTLIGRTLHVKFWRVPRADIPAGEEAERAWLYDLFDEIEGWLDDPARSAS